MFVPSEDSINSLVDSVKSKFAFIEVITSSVDEIKTMLSTNENLPVLKITLPHNKWYNGELTVIDLNWYAQYKQYGDTVISGFMYLFFIWRIYINLASIINGTGGAVHDIAITSTNDATKIRRNR